MYHQRSGIVTDHDGCERGDHGQGPHAPVVNGLRRRPVLDTVEETHLTKGIGVWGKEVVMDERRKTKRLDYVQVGGVQ